MNKAENMTGKKPTAGPIQTQNHYQPDDMTTLSRYCRGTGDGYSRRFDEENVEKYGTISEQKKQKTKYTDYHPQATELFAKSGTDNPR